MPMFVSTNGLLITVFAFLHSSFATTKLSVVPSLHPSTTEPFPNTTMSVNTTRENSPRGSRYLQNNDMYRWHGISPSSPQTDYTYPDYPSTSPGDLSTITYPFITTQKPALRHLKFRPRITKLQVKSVRRGQGAKDIFSDSSSMEEAEADFVPLVSLYGTQMGRWSQMPSQYTYGSHPGKTVTGFSSSSTGGSSYGHSGYTFSGGSGSGFEDLHESASHHHVPIIHQVHHTPKFDMKKLGILALIKIGLAKFKAFGILKFIFLMLLKLKLFLLAAFVKFVLLLKALKILKSILIPLILLSVLIPVLLALFLLPFLLLSLLPMLAPLLSMLPLIPAINIRPKARIQFKNSQEDQKPDPFAAVMDHLMESAQCVERISCELATKKEAKLFFPFINWYLSKISLLLQNEKITTYVDIYSKTVKEYKGKHTDEAGEQWCAAKYQCPDADLSVESSSKEKKFAKVLEPPANYTG